MSDNKLDKIVACIREGNQTRAEVIAAAGCTTNAFASYLTSLRNAAKYAGTNICPIEKDLDGKKVLVMGSYEEFEALKAASASASSAGVEKPLAEQHAAAIKNVNKTAMALAKFQARKDAGEKFEKGGIDDLRFQIAKLNAQLAQKLQEALPALPEVEGTDEVEGEQVADTEEQLL